MYIDYSDQFSKQLQKSPLQIKIAFHSRLDLFLSNQHHPLLRVHALTGAYAGCKSINVTGDWRAIFKDIDHLIEEPHVFFIALGTHSQLYR